MCPPEAFTSTAGASTLEPDSFVPQTEISKVAFKFATFLLHPAILNHSIRVYLYARDIAAAKGSRYHDEPDKQDLLFIACIFHDMGTTDAFNGASRFEVEGADAAVKHLAMFKFSVWDKRDVWNAIALHTCNGIVQRMGDLAAILRLAIEIDFGRTDSVDGIDDLAALKATFEEKFERKDIEIVLADAVVAQAVKNPAKAPSNSWPGGLYRAYLQDPEWKGVNKAFGA
ncbi:hypothetical protein P280DRAFT_119702 [Massarina eburnea CBS 473.64]|uniref:HD/PDEase domain-containing protein n=1 Tax=Massarina eburnea CBS 473.64 TaxID=1395130 RepID=A0A6A6SG60_9PLEO|nr:hypothetical protein P280DRAFT_119702 [Massarina eburnea CBS 473.64]